MADKTPSAGHTLKELAEDVAGQLTGGTSPQTLIDQLVAHGWPRVTAQHFVANASHLSMVYQAGEHERDCAVQRYKQQTLRGALWVILGIGIVVVSFTMCDAACGFCHFALGVGLCVVEFLDMCTGLCGWRGT